MVYRGNIGLYIGLHRGLGFPKIGVTFLGVPIIRVVVFWGIYWGPLLLGNHHVGIQCILRRFGDFSSVSSLGFRVSYMSTLAPV